MMTMMVGCICDIDPESYCPLSSAGWVALLGVGGKDWKCLDILGGVPQELCSI